MTVTGKRITRHHYVDFEDYEALEDIAFTLARKLKRGDVIRERIREMICNDVLYTYENYNVLYELVRDAQGVLGVNEKF